jgi:hypothetical protein
MMFPWKKINALTSENRIIIRKSWYDLRGFSKLNMY